MLFQSVRIKEMLVLFHLLDTQADFAVASTLIVSCDESKDRFGILDTTWGSAIICPKALQDLAKSVVRKGELKLAQKESAEIAL